MGEIINLRIVRKAKGRRQAADSAAANRAKFGQSKAEKAVQRLDAERSERQHSGARRESDTD